jgi:hypothetical protein
MTLLMRYTEHEHMDVDVSHCAFAPAWLYRRLKRKKRVVMHGPLMTVVKVVTAWLLSVFKQTSFPWSRHTLTTHSLPEH